MVTERKIQFDELLVILICLYVTSIVLAFAVAVKLVALPFGLSASVGTITVYALSYVITDVISELYGYKAARFAVRIALINLAIALVVFQICVHLPPAAGWLLQEDFTNTLGYPFRIAIGGVIGYFVAQQVDIWVYHKIKHATHGRFLWLRNNVSTALAQLTDSVVWISIAFLGVVPNIFTLITGEYLIKLVIAVIDTIIIYAVVKGLLKRRARKELKRLEAE